mgnify:CR=1 FL=1
MNPLETLLSPLARTLNRNIGESTTARELCRQLDGKVVAIRVRDTGLAMVFEFSDELLELNTEIGAEPDVVLTGSLVTLARLAGPDRGLGAAEQAALAYPDRVGLRRPGEAPRWLLSGGKGAALDAADPLAGARLLVVTETDGHPTEATIRGAFAISEVKASPSVSLISF